MPAHRPGHRAGEQLNVKGLAAPGTFIDDGQVNNVPSLVDEAGARFPDRTAVTIGGRP